MKIGFVGTGAITEAIVTGVLGSTLPVSEIHLSPRSRDISASLAEKSAIVHVADDNQGVVDASDTVFLAIRPQIAEEVITGLRFRPGQRVISLVATLDLNTLKNWIRQDVLLAQAIPLPFVAERQGVTAIFPPDADVASFFAALGTAVEAQTKSEYDLLAAASALMGTYFGILETSTRWLESKGLPYEQAKAYVAPLFASLSERAVKSQSRSFAHLQSEFSTRGGLNEQASGDFDRHGGSAALEKALDGLLKRIEAK
ncbi:MAG: pyrroline-5-carboxylate reductase [Pararhizobium sp.]